MPQDDPPARARRPAAPPSDRDDGVFVRRHPPRKGVPVWVWLLGSGVGLVIICGCGVLGLIAVRTFGAAQVTDGPEFAKDWTVSQVVEHLNSKGLRCKLRTTDDEDEDEQGGIVECPDESLFWIMRCKNTGVATRLVSPTEGQKSFAWGRFLIKGDPKPVLAAKQILRSTDRKGVD